MLISVKGLTPRNITTSLGNSKGILKSPVKVSYAHEEFLNSITTRVLQIQMTCMRTFWKAYEILYKLFINIKA